MATISTNANGKALEDFVFLHVLGNEAIEKGSVKIHELIDSNKLEVPKFRSAANLIQARKATPDSGDSLGGAIREKMEIIPADMMTYFEENPRDFEVDWKQFYPKGNLPDKIENPKVLKAITKTTQERTHEQLGKLIWQGDTGSGDPTLVFFDGFVTQAIADAAVIDVPAAGVITKANILDRLDEVRNAIPKSVVSKKNMKIHVSTNTLFLYQDAVNDLTYKGAGPTDVVASRYKGIEIVDYVGFPDDHILAAVGDSSDDSNLRIGVETIKDDSAFKFERKQANSELFFFKALFKMACGIAFGEEVVLYVPV
jgi:hypothetical protein